MLKNKFGMLKVLTLVLSVLMLVSLVACGNSGVAEDDMNAAIQAALEEQAKVEASKQEALASSLAAAQAEAEAKQAAAESSLAAAQAAASKAAADASKAAADAEKKASEAAASASKAAAEASKAAASASEALKTTKATTTTTAAPIVKDDITAVQAKFAELKHELTNPLGNGKYYNAASYAELILLFDKAAVELQNALTVAAAESILATVEVEARAIKNAKTEIAAIEAMIEDLGDVETGVFTTVLEKKDEAKLAVGQFFLDYAEFYETVALAYFNEDALKDAYVKDAEDMVRYLDEDLKVPASTLEAWTERLGLTFDLETLEDAEAKIEILTAYIAASLQNDMKVLYATHELDFDEDGKDLDKDLVTGDDALDFIWDAYYKYLVIAAVNGGDVAAADLAIEYDYLYDETTGKVVRAAANDTDHTNPLYFLDENWDWKNGDANKAYYEEGAKIYDKKAPTAWFTAEEFIEIYAYPCLNELLAIEIADAIEQLKDEVLAATKNADALIYTSIIDKNNEYVAPFEETEDALEEVFDAFEAELEELTFVGDYKGNATVYNAQYDIWAKYADAYIAAANALVEASKDYALEVYNDKYEALIDELDEDYEDRTDEASLAAKAQRLANYDAKKEAFEANVESAPVYTFETLNDKALLEKYDENYKALSDEEKDYFDLTDYIGLHGVDADFNEYVNAVMAQTVKKAFSHQKGDQEGYLGDAVAAFVEDLLIFRDRIDPTNDEADIYVELRGTVIPYANGEGYVDDKYYSNTAKFEQLVASVDKAIDDLYAVSVDNYSDKEVQLITPDNDAWGAKKGKVYWINEQAKAWYEASEHDHEWLINEEFLANADLTVDGKKVHDQDENGLVYAACACGQNIKTAADAAADHLKVVNGEYVACDCQVANADGSFNVPTYVKDTSRGKVICKGVKEGDFLTLNNTGVPFNYTQTAEQLAIIAAQNIYKTVYTDIQAAVIVLPELNYLAEAVKGVTGATEYKAIVSNVSGNEALKAEVEAYAKVYTDKMTSESKNVKYGFTGNSFKTPASFSGYVNVNPEEQFSYNDKFGTNADRYDYDNVVTKLNEYITKFDNTFYTANKADSNVVELWYFKQDAVEYITNTINGFESVVSNQLVWNPGYKNTYKAETANNVTTITQRAGSYYVYDAGLTAASTAGKKFDTELANLLDTYVGKIEAVTLNSRVEWKNYYGERICSKAGDFGWSLNTAQNLVKAYVTDLLGVDEAGDYARVDKNNYTNTTYEAKNGSVYTTGDSRVLLAYKTIYEGDFTAYAPTINCACGNAYNP